MAESKLSEVVAPVVAQSAARPPEIPRVFAKYLNLRDWKAIDPKKTPNAELVKHLIDAVIYSLKMIYPASAAKIAITISYGGMVQLIMLMRMMALSAATIGFSNMDILIMHMKEKTPLSSIERDIWLWFDSVCMNPSESLRNYVSTFSVDELVTDYVATVITEDMRATDIAAIGIAKMQFNDIVAQCAVQEIIDFVKFRMIKICEALIEIDEKVSVRFTAADISGILRSTWRGGSINRQFYSDLASFGETFGDIKKYCKSLEDAAKPKRGRKVKPA